MIIHVKKVLLKNEDIRIDYIISKIIYFIKNITDIKDNFINYHILPINNKCGFIEIVDKSNTLYYIKEELNVSLQNYIMDKNKEKNRNNQK